MTDTSMEEYSDTVETKKPQKEVTVVQDQGFFQHHTGDIYDGFFEAKKKDRSLKMNGPGVYKTVEGDIYSGIWDADKFNINEEASIAYKDGARFEGTIKDWSYSGKGKYIYPDASALACNFIENCPVGDLVLTDPNNHTWLGKAEQGFGWFAPVNHYYELLEKTRDFAGLKKRNKKKANQELKETSKALLPIPESPTKAKPKK